jgi:hypothetical protein
MGREVSGVADDGAELAGGYLREVKGEAHGVLTTAVKRVHTGEVVLWNR